METKISKIPPTMRKIKDALLQYIDAEKIQDGDLLIAASTRIGSFERLHPYANMIGESFTGAAKEDTKAVVQVALKEFEKIALQHPDIRGELTLSLNLLLLAASKELVHLHTKNFTREHASMRPLNALNDKKAALTEHAQAIASELWKADTSKKIRIGEMADKVYRALSSEGFTELLPGTAERIKEWIKPSAPDYARKGGRRRKTS